MNILSSIFSKGTVKYNPSKKTFTVKLADKGFAKFLEMLTEGVKGIEIKSTTLVWKVQDETKANAVLDILQMSKALK